MKIEEILTSVKPSYGDTWEGVKELFTTDLHERRRVDELKAELTERGMQAPGRITWDEEEEEFFLTNGTHRFVASWELGLSDFTVVQEGEPAEESSTAWEYSTTLNLWLSGETTMSEAEEETLFSCFMSSFNFRLNDDHWIELLFSSSTGLKSKVIKHEFVFDYLAPELLPSFTEAALKRVACCLDSSLVIDVETSSTLTVDDKFWKSALA